MRDRREQVERVVRELGFDRIGVAAAELAPRANEYREWIRRGYHGEMHYLAKNLERRLSPELVVDGARSVIVLATDYRQQAPDADREIPSDEGKISVYAQGEDYHRVLEKRLKAGCTELSRLFPGESFRYYVDTGPAPEKAWAERAGVGWIGKNCCSIDTAAGSFFFLSVIFTTLELPFDDAAEDHCGTCRACLDACPTQAFVEPYVLDARRCISYLNIEQRDVVSDELAESTGQWVFGCDICQDVCPWNRQVAAGDEELAPRPENVAPKLADLTSLDDEGFRERFARSPIKRTKHQGFLRNVADAVGNSQLPDYEDLLDAIESQSHSAPLQQSVDRARKKRKAKG